MNTRQMRLAGVTNASTGILEPYPSIAAALADIAQSLRHPALIVYAKAFGVAGLYHFKNGVADSNLVALSSVVSTASTIMLPEITIDHTNGVENNFFGVGVGPNYDGVHGVSSGGGNMTLTPDNSYWRSEPGANPVATAISVKSNIKAADITTGIQVSIQSAFKAADGSANFYAPKTLTFNSQFFTLGTLTKGKVASPGVVNTPALVGDVDTQFITESNLNGIPIGGAAPGGGLYYWSISVFIPANAATKDYKFKISLDALT